MLRGIGRRRHRAVLAAVPDLPQEAAPQEPRLRHDVDKIASVADAAKATSTTGKVYAVGKAVVLETGASVATNVTQAAIEGEDKSSAALGALASSPVSTLGGAAVEKLAGTRTTLTAGKTVVGAVSGGVGAAAGGKDVLTGALTGAGGGLYGGLAGPVPGDVAAVGEAPAPGTEPPAELPAAAATVALPPAPEAAGALPPGPEAPRALAPGPAEPLALPPGPAEPLALPPAPESAGPTSAGAGGEAGLPGALAELQTATGARISGSDVAGGEGWKLVTARKGDEFEAFGEPGKTSFRWLARVPEANWEWAERGNQLVPTWYTGKEGTPAVLVRYRVRLNEDVTAAMSKVADQPGALERLGPAKFQYFLPAGFEHHATVERIEVVKVLLPPR